MKTASFRYGFAFLTLGLVTACGDALDPSSRVVSLRVLAQETDIPYAAPGETVHVRSLVHDPEGRTLNWAWAACVNPSSTGVDGCIAKLAMDSADTGSLTLLASGPSVDAVDVPIPADALSSLPESARSSASVGVLSVACPGTLTPETGATGMPFRCAEADSGRELGLDEFVVGVKRIVVRSQDRNQNPVIARITFNGAEWPEDQVQEFSPCNDGSNNFGNCAGNEHKLAAEVTPESFENGKNEFGDDFSEQLVVQYFATEGTFESDSRIAQSPVNKWSPRKQATGQDLTFWFVARDSRGGVTWTSRRGHVQ
jgi:hypothetical protein